MKRKVFTILLALAMVLSYSICLPDTNSSAASSWWSGLTPVNMGDFYANLGAPGTKSMSVNANNNYNVGYLEAPETEAERVKSDVYKARFWRYKRLDDGSYKITSCLYTDANGDARPLEAVDSSAGSNVKLGESYSGKATQRWFFYIVDGDTYIRSAASDCVLYLHDNNNLMLYTKNSASISHEKMWTYKFNTISGTTTLTVDAADSDNETVFTWTKPTGDVAWYNIWIHQIDSNGQVIDKYDIKDILADNSMNKFVARKKLPAGYYIARVVPHSWVNYVVSEDIPFTVTQGVQECTHSSTEISDYVAPTCTEDGYTGNTVCKNCHELISYGKTIAATGHDFSSSIVTQDATCLQTGIRTYVCSGCGETEIEAIPKTDHSWDSGTIAKKAKYFSTGVKTYTCTICGSTRSQSIPALNPAPVTPAKVKLTSAKTASKKLTVKWKRIAKNTKGYQIAIKDRKTGKQKYINAKQSSKSTLTKTIKNLKKNRKYSVRIRAYNVIGDETIYGAWSNVKTGKVK